METALDLITNSLLDLGVLADEETPTASQAAGGLRKLNNLIDAWNIEGLMVYGSSAQTFPLTGGQASYTYGPSGNFDAVRPATIESAYIVNPSLPLEQRYNQKLYIYNDAEYADIAFQGMQGIPYGVWFDDSYPLVNVNLFPVPSTNEYSLMVWSAGQIGNLLLNDPINLAPGYKRALEANLTVELAPSYEREPSQVTVSVAQSSKANLKIKNLEINELQTGFGRRYNIMTNRYV